MKKQVTLFIATMVAFSFLNAQTLDPANLPKTALKLTKTSKQTMNQKVTAAGQDMSSRSDNNVTATYDISAITAQGGTAEIKITAMKISSESDAGEASYDSKNPDDGSPALADVANSAMKNPIKITLDANGLVATVKGMEKMEAMSKGSGDGGLKKGDVLDVFLKLDKPVKIGDTWKKSTDNKQAKVTSDFTYKSFENGMATIEVMSILKLEQGLEGKVVSTLTVDAKTLVIKNKTSTMVINGTVSEQGQSADVSIFSNATETVE